MLSHPLPRQIPLPSSIKHFVGLLANSLYDILPVYWLRTHIPSIPNLRGLCTLLSVQGRALPTVLQNSFQRTTHGVLSKYLLNENQHIKFLTIACLAQLAKAEPHEPDLDAGDHPQSLFEGAKGAKVVKLVISTVLGTLSKPATESGEIIRLCSIAIGATDPTLIKEWIDQKTSAPHLKKMKEKTEAPLDASLLSAVSHYFGFLIPSTSNFSML